MSYVRFTLNSEKSLGLRLIGKRFQKMSIVKDRK